MLKAKVHGGRLILDEPVDMTEGSEVELVVVNYGDDLDDEDRARLQEALRVAERALDAGLTVDADKVIRQMRASRVH